MLLKRVINNQKEDEFPSLNGYLIVSHSTYHNLILHITKGRHCNLNLVGPIAQQYSHNGHQIPIQPTNLHHHRLQKLSCPPPQTPSHGMGRSVSKKKYRGLWETWMDHIQNKHRVTDTEPDLRTPVIHNILFIYKSQGTGYDRIYLALILYNYAPAAFNIIIQVFT